jgi:hypothetical protein
VLFFLLPVLPIVELLFNTIHTLFAASLKYPVNIHRFQDVYNGSSQDVRYCLSALIGTRVSKRNDNTQSLLLIRHTGENGYHGDRYYRVDAREDSLPTIIGQAVVMAFLTL